MPAASASLMGVVRAVSVSLRKGEKKNNVARVELVEGHGIPADAHAGDWHRQISLLAMESIAKIRAAGMDVAPGDFAENITTEGLELWRLPVGTRLQLGATVVLEVTQIGKECHQRCAIFHQVGDCVMPREGIFARVLQRGTVQAGDPVIVLDELPGRASVIEAAGAGHPPADDGGG
jgi:MOSC domain-containing protein YiiM